MININYSPYPKKRNDKLTKELKEIITKKSPYHITSIEGNCSIITVESPFILADNEFDMREANNTLIEINVKRIKTVSFTGGSCYIVYEKKPNTPYSYIIHGNDEEGYNIFEFI